MWITRLLLTLLLLLLCLPAHGWGATYYMRADGTAANKGAASGPCATQANCMSIATHDGETFSAGDTIILCDDGGTYRDQMDIPSSGSSGSPIIYENANGDAPVISGSNDITTSGWADQGGNVWRHVIGVTEPEIIIFDGTVVGVVDATPDAQYEWTYSNPNLDIYAEDDPDNAVYYASVEATQRDYGIYANNKNYITISGLTIIHANNCGICFNGDGYGNNNVLSCEVETCQAGIRIGNDDMRVYDTSITDIQEDGIEAHGADTPLRGEIAYCTISDVDNEDSGGDCIQINSGSEDWEIHNNTLTHDTENKQAIIDAGVSTKIYENTITFLKNGIHVTGGTGHEIYRNYLIGTRLVDGTSNPFAVEESLSDCSGVVHTNIIGGTVYRFFYIDEHNGNSASWEVYNNSGYISDDGQEVDSTNAILVMTGTPTLTYKNNAFERESGSGVYGICTSNHAWTYTGTNNVWYPDGVHYWKGSSKSNLSDIQDESGSPEADSLFTDPAFVDPANDDYTLQQGSPCRDTGDNAVWSGTADVTDIVGTPITDGNGAIVAPGGTVDIGAYEYTLYSFTDDVDDDGISDGNEYYYYGTNPHNIDTDGDSIQDGTEKGLTEPDGSSTNMTIFIPDADPSTATDPTNPDTDGDGLLDGEEDINHNGRVDPGETDPLRDDSENIDDDSDGFTENQGDCDDADPEAYPSADELCDSKDNDCDGDIDERCDLHETGTASSGDGCFIATAAFGSYVSPHLKVIANFRDRYLLTNMPGRWFVGMYNRYGPFWADLIKAHPWCRPVVRLALMPVVGTSYFLVKTSLATKLLTGFLLVGLIVILVLRIHDRSDTSGPDLVP